MESCAKVKGMYNFFVNGAEFYDTFVTEVAFTRAGWRYCFLFMFWDAFEVAIIYLAFVETRGRALEELAVNFWAGKLLLLVLRRRQVRAGVRYGCGE